MISSPGPSKEFPVIGKSGDEVYRKGSSDMAVVSLIHPSARGLTGTPDLVSVSSIHWWPAPGGWKLFGEGPGGRASWQQTQAGGEGGSFSGTLLHRLLLPWQTSRREGRGPGEGLRHICYQKLGPGAEATELVALDNPLQKPDSVEMSLQTGHGGQLGLSVLEEVAGITRLFLLGSRELPVHLLQRVVDIRPIQVSASLCP